MEKVGEEEKRDRQIDRQTNIDERKRKKRDLGGRREGEREEENRK